MATDEAMKRRQEWVVAGESASKKMPEGGELSRTPPLRAKVCLSLAVNVRVQRSAD